MNISVTQAKANFSDLIRRVEAGESIVLTRIGKPVARLSDAGKQAPKLSIVGAAKGKVVIRDDFDVLGPEWGEYLY